LSGVSVVTDDVKLRIPTSHEEVSVTAGTVAVIVTHSTLATFTSTVAIPVPVPSVAAVIPPPTAIIIVIRR
jgi:hypothetical protein